MPIIEIYEPRFVFEVYGKMADDEKVTEADKLVGVGETPFKDAHAVDVEELTGEGAQAQAKKVAETYGTQAAMVPCPSCGNSPHPGTVEDRAGRLHRCPNCLGSGQIAQ